MLWYYSIRTDGRGAKEFQIRMKYSWFPVRLNESEVKAPEDALEERNLSICEHPTDEELVRLCRTGDRQAFEILVRRHITRVYGFCLHMLRSKEEAEDAVQDTFSSAFRNLASFRGDATFSTWLRRVAYNKSLDIIRRRQARNSLGNDMEGTDPLGGNRGDPEAELLKRAESDLLWRLVGRLPPRQRAVMILFYREDLSYEEISKALGVPKRTVETRLYRARRALTELWRREQGGEPT